LIILDLHAFDLPEQFWELFLWLVGIGQQKMMKMTRLKTTDDEVPHCPSCFGKRSNSSILGLLAGYYL
jgi:hypothetical protein